jgi:hypothetical protein
MKGLYTEVIISCKGLLWMVYYALYYWVSGLCSLSGFWNRKQYFRNWICFCPQVKRTYLVKSVRKI